MSRRLLVLVCTCLLAALSPLSAQIETGTLLGTIEDPTGAVVPGASVNIRSLESGVMFPVSTNEAGRFQSPPLKPGLYEIGVTSPGFKQTSAQVRVEVNQRVVFNVQLEVGETTETIEVVATAVQLESASSTLGNIRPEKAVAELPLNSRNFGQLIFLSAGSVPSFDRNAGGLPGTTRRGATNASINGVRPSNDYNSILIEGLDNASNHNGFGVAVYPPTDAVQEFKVQTSGADAQFGRAAGGFTNLVLKSGGQDFHGSLWEFHRNSEFDAKNFFAAPTGSTHFVMNQFGGTIGGPIVRDKTFFFFSTQLDRRRQAQAFVNTVPLPAYRNGDFSSLSDALMDPLTGDPYPNNVIPSSDFNAVGKNAIDLYPDPNQPGTANNFARSPGRIYDQWATDFKIDHYFNTKHSMVFRGSTGNTDIIEGTPLPLPAASSVGPSEFPAHQLAFIDRYTFSPSLLNEFRAGVTRVNMQLLQPNVGDDVAQRIGIPGVNTGDDITSGLPRINYTGFVSLGDDPFNPGILASNNFQYEDIVFWTRGNHSIRFGGRFDRRQYNAFQTAGIRGILNHSGVYTGNSIGDGLLGAPINGNINILDGTRGFRRWDIGLFVQDDWKVSNRLTVNLGLRYEISPQYPWNEVGDRASQFIPSTGDLIPFGTGDVGRNGIRSRDYNNWSPRIGLAYRFGEKTVMRAAYGIYYAYPTYEISRHPAINPPWAGAFAFANNQNNIAAARTIDQGFERSFNNDRSALWSQPTSTRPRPTSSNGI